MSIRVAALGDGLCRPLSLWFPDFSRKSFQLKDLASFTTYLVDSKRPQGGRGWGHILSGPSSLGRCRSSEDRGDKFADFSHRLVQLEGKPHQVHAFEFTMLLQENLPCRIVG